MTDTPPIEASPQAGFFGKLPTHGDFLSRGLTNGFIDPWDRWLQASLARSQADLGDRWLEYYLGSPIWKFALRPGIAGDAAYVGVLIPSVDRVGRYFPLSAVRTWPMDVGLPDLFEVAEPWLESAAAVLLRALQAEMNDPDQLGREFAEVGTDFRIPRKPTRDTEIDWRAHDRWRFGIGPGASPQARIAQLLWADWVARLDPVSLWWTDGSSRVEPSVLCVRGLPSPQAYGSMLSGFTEGDAWFGDVQSTKPAAARSEASSAAVWISSSVSHPGHARTDNQDAFLALPDKGLWAVADGMGGHSHGEVASRAAVDALQKVYLTGGLEADIDRVKLAIGTANSIVYHFSQGSDAPCVAGSTLVALLLTADRGAVLWAGDSRAYQFRGASTRQLTVDHSAPEGDGAITRAVGGEATIAVDVVQFEVQGGDRFLLCSDGLHSELELPQLWRLVVDGDLETAAARLTNAVLATPARDNFTAIVIGKNPAAAQTEIMPHGHSDAAQDRAFPA